MVLQTKPVKIVKAVSISEAQVKAEVAKVKPHQQKKQQPDQVELNRLKQQQVEAQKKLLALKESQQKALQKKKEEQKQAEVKKQQAQAIEKQKLAELEKKKKQQAIDEQKRKQAEKQRLAKEMFERQVADEQMMLESVRGGYVDNEVNKCLALIRQAIEQQWIIPGSYDPNARSLHRVRISPSGTILSIELIRSSGNPAVDRSMRTAILQAAPFPVPSDPEIFAKIDVVDVEPPDADQLAQLKV